MPVPAASPTGWTAGIPVATGRNAVSIVGGTNEDTPRATMAARWTGREWAAEELPADVTEHSEMSSVTGIAGVPGTNGVFATGLAGCAGDPVQCGLLVSRYLR
ncbi:hypothetical protein [Streptomyces sp. NPDC059850]|uniref:hypothetical protein n=1 Tax=Streptomyces sp. NPDC059850 TaxID=3346970 RepID=UPI0036693729